MSMTGKADRKWFPMLNMTGFRLSLIHILSRRTINRDIEDICKAGIPIVTTRGVNGGISIMEGYRMDKTLLTSREMQSILAGLRSLDSVSSVSYTHLG